MAGATHAHPTRRSLLLGAAGALGTTTAATAVAGCGGSSGNETTWSVWGNPGEVRRLQEFTDDFNGRHETQPAKLTSVPTDSYESKILTQLSGNKAPDVFYASPSLLARMVKNGNVLDLSSRLNGSKSKSRPEEFFDSLWSGVARDGKAIWGVPVDCNPIIVWFNKKVLRDAGVTTMPTELYKAGRWNREAFTTMAEQVRAKGTSAAAQADSPDSVYAWMTAAGGKIFDGEEFVAHEDPKSVEAMEWVMEMLRSKVFMYAGSLPSGQGPESLFMSNRVAFSTGVGRWVLPLFRENKNLDFDVVPYPSFDGKLPSTPVAVASMVVNKAAKDKEKAFAFVTEFVSRQGQIFRLKGQGNAVPAVRGADQVVREGKKPEHAQYFLDLRANGYVDFEAESKTSGLRDEIIKMFGEMFAKKTDARTGLQRIGTMANRAIANGSVE